MIHHASCIMHPTPCIVIAVFDHWSFRNKHSKPMFPKLFFDLFMVIVIACLINCLNYCLTKPDGSNLPPCPSLSLTHPRFNSTNVQASYCPLSLSLFLFLLYTTITTSSRRSPDDASSTTKTSKNQPTLTRPRQPPLLGGGSIAGVGGGVNPSPEG